MKKYWFLFLIFIGFSAYSTYLTFPSDLMYVPTTNTITSDHLIILASQLMATTPYGYKFNTDWFEEDLSIGMGFKIPWNNLKFELLWTQYTLVQGQGQYGAFHIKINFFEDPIMRFSKEKLENNPRLKYLPSMAFGIRNITGKGIRYISPTGNDSPILSNYSFYIVFSKYILYRLSNHLQLSFGLGGRDFIGYGKMRNNGIFSGIEYTHFFKNTYLKAFFEYSSRGFAIGGEFAENVFFVRFGINNLQTILNSFKEDRGIEINVAIGTNASMKPITHIIPFFNKRYYAEPPNLKILPPLFTFKPIYFKTKPLFSGIVFPGWKLPNINEKQNNILVKKPKPMKNIVTEKEVKIIKVKNGLQIQTKKINFAINSARILPSSYRIINSVARILKQYPNYYLIIEGHTDASGSFINNYYLSKNRAEAVKTYLLKQLGPDNEKKIFTFGFSSKFPIASNKTIIGRSLNRRVDFYLIPQNKISVELQKREQYIREIQNQINSISAQPSAITKKTTTGLFNGSISKKPKKVVKKPQPKKNIVKKSLSIASLISNGRYNDAIKQLENKLKIEKSFVKKIGIKKQLSHIYFMYAKQLLSKKNLNQGITYLKKTNIYKNSSDYENAYYMLGQLSYNQGKYEQAIKYFNGVLSNYKYLNAATYDNDDEALFKIIGCLIKMGKMNLAKSLLKKFPKQYPKSKLNTRVKLILEKLQ